MDNKYIKKPNIVRLFDRLPFLLFWLRWFYPDSKGIGYAYLLFTFFPQKILRINGSARWPVHFTSRVLYPKKITVGNRSAPGLNSNCYIQGRSGIIIGHNFRMGPGCGLISANHSKNDYDKWIYSKPIIIGDNVWLGMNVVVLPSVEIGNNVIIGANSVVNKNIPPNSIAVGNPCKVINKKSAYTGFNYGVL